MDPEFQKFLDQQGIPSPAQNLTDEDPPEPVDEKKLRAFHSGELSGPDAELISFYVTRYRAWANADRRLTEEGQK